MELMIIAIVAFVAAGLTLFSGFGLGTILLPAFAIFFPVDIAIALTAIVHLLNNIFKLQIYRKNIDKRILLTFGIPAIIASYFGAVLLVNLTSLEPLVVYNIGGKTFEILPIKLVIGTLLNLFAIIEILPKFSSLSFDKKYLPLGGILSGFFGGLSGHQGALRSAFLLRAGLTKESFIGTGVAVACLIDVIRLFEYGTASLSEAIQNNYYLLLFAIIAAFSGSYIGARLVKKVTIKSFQISVAVMLFVIADLMILGII
jgi:uncharacterized protein